MFKDRSLNYATAKRAKIRKVHVFEKSVLNEKVDLTCSISKTARYKSTKIHYWEEK